MTSQGHAVSRFARAVKTGNPNIVVAAAAELPRLSLADALLVLLVFARARAPQAETAAVRWAARYVAEVRPAPDAREERSVVAGPTAGPSPRSRPRRSRSSTSAWGEQPKGSLPWEKPMIVGIALKTTS